MPDGRTHRMATLAGAAVTATAILWYSHNGRYALAHLAGWLVTLAINPDLDLNFKVVKRGLDSVWKVVWWPYSRLAKHRSFISHFPIISTVIRLGLLCLYLAPLIYALGIDFHPNVYWIILVVGAVFSDTLHYFMDKISTGVKRWQH